MLCDFELLREEAEFADSAGSTTTVVGGTPAYMAPERVRGNKPTQASDMYSLGVVILLCFAPSRIKQVTHLQPIDLETTDEHELRDKLCGLILSKPPVSMTKAQLMALGMEELKVRAESLHRTPPEQVRADVAKSLPKDINATLTNLLSEARNRPTAQQLLPKDGDEQSSNYFSQADLELPSYWQPGDDEIIEVKDDDIMLKLTRVVQSYKPDEFGKGRDAGKHWDDLNLDSTDRSIKVEKAWHVQNPEVWKTYVSARERIANDVARGPPIDSDDPRVKKRDVIMKPAIAGRIGGCSEGGQALERAADEGFTPGGEDKALRSVNETFMLHGLKKSTLVEVLQKGLNERFAGSNAGALFGAGTYFAQDIEKVDQYTGDADTSYEEPGLDLLHSKLYPRGATDDPAEDVCYALVCRVALGYIIRTTNRQKFKDKTGTYRDSQNCVAMDGDSVSPDTGLVFVNDAARELVKVPETAGRVHYHSLLAETTKGGQIERFREFITFNSARTYPEFVVAYKRCSKSEGTGHAMSDALLLEKRAMKIICQFEARVEEATERKRNDAVREAAAGRDDRTLPLRILCIDGGGIKGLIPAIILRELERLCKRPIHELFDLVCGTSTGGIIALGTCVAKTPVDDMVDIYRNRAEEIWKERGMLHTLSERLIRPSSGKYDASGLEQILKEQSKKGGRQMMLNEEINAWPKVFVTTLKMAQEGEQTSTAGQSELLCSYKPLSGTGNCELWQAARATGAAPTYFDPIEIGGHKYIDGGLKLNNPTMKALEEAHSLWPGRKIGTIVSLGCGQMLSTHTHSLSGMVDLVTETEETHTNFLKTVMGCKSISKEEQRLGCLRKDGGMQGERLAEDALYARLNPMLEGTLNKVPMDTKNERDLKRMEEAAESFVTDPSVAKTMRQVKNKLCATESKHHKPESEPELEPEPGREDAMEWAEYAEKVCDKLDGVSLQEAWAALDRAAAERCGPAAASLAAYRSRQPGIAEPEPEPGSQ